MDSPRNVPHVVAVSHVMRDVVALAERVAPTEANLLVVGESGTGKDLLARRIHELGPRASGAYVEIDCGTLPEALLEAELFGYERGAFTGAAAAKPGRMETAQGGTLVLDEVTALTLQAQAKLLRVIEERRFTRLGGRTSVALDIRLICLTNVDLRDAVGRGAFRADLFHRLNVISIELPPLRDHRGDVPALVEHFLETARRRHQKPPLVFSAEAMTVLGGYDFPGNVRELFHIVERAVILSEGGTVGAEALPPALTSAAALMRSRERRPTLAELEAAYVREVLQATRGQKKRAAEILGISRKNLYEKMRAYGIPYAQRRKQDPASPNRT